MADVDEHQKIASLSGLTGMKNSNEESAADASAALKQVKILHTITKLTRHCQSQCCIAQ